MLLRANALGIDALVVDVLEQKVGQTFWQVGQIQEKKSSEGQNLVQRDLGGPRF
jgi:hypothetical protein